MDIACVAGVKRGREGEEGKKGGELGREGKGRSLPFSPLFSLPLPFLHLPHRLHG